MINLIRKILKEEIDERTVNFIVNSISSGSMKPPYLKRFRDFDLTNEEIISIMVKFFNTKSFNIILDDFDLKVYNKKGNKPLYKEFSDGSWFLSKLDERDHEIYYETSDGDWQKSEYDEMGNRIYNESSSGFWERWEYDEFGRRIYYENSFGEWEKRRV